MDAVCFALLVSLTCNIMQMMINVYKCYYDEKERRYRIKSNKEMEHIQSENSGVWI